MAGTPFQIEFERGSSIKWLDRRYFPKDKHGVYVVYNYNGEVIYVGKTLDKVGFFGRLSSNHQYFDTFKKDCDHIEFFYLENSLEILMFERAKILQFDPLLNRDDDERIVRSQNYEKAVNDEFALFQYYVLNDSAIVDEMERRKLTEDEMVKLFNKNHPLIRNEVSLDSIVYDTQPDFFPTKYFCSKCMDLGEVENDFGKMEFCDCQIGDNLSFELYGKHIGE